MQLLRKTFCELSGIPINIYSNPHFLNRIKLLDPLYHTDALWVEFLKAADYYKTSKDYLAHINSLSNQMSTLIANRLTPKMIDTIARGVDMNNNRVDAEVYKEYNVGKKFIRINLKDKYFAALYWVNSSIVDNKKSYAEFIRQYTEDRNVICNLDVQGRIFGADKNISLRFVLDALTIKLLTETVHKVFAHRQVWKSCDGEIIVELANNQDIISYNNLADALIKWGNFYKINFNIEAFTLGYISGVGTYIKRFETGKSNKDNFELVNPDPNTVAMVTKVLLGYSIQEADKYFEYNGKLSKFLEVPEISVTYDPDKVKTI